jgi:hypothetical protein
LTGEPKTPRILIDNDAERSATALTTAIPLSQSLALASAAPFIFLRRRNKQQQQQFQMRSPAQSSIRIFASASLPQIHLLCVFFRAFATGLDYLGNKTRFLTR